MDFQIVKSNILIREVGYYAQTQEVNYYLSYQTGIDFFLFNQFSISPTIIFPLISFYAVFDNPNKDPFLNYNNDVNPFTNYIKAGIIFTYYTKTKKQ